MRGLSCRLDDRSRITAYLEVIHLPDKRGRGNTNLRRIRCCPLLGRAKKLYGRKHPHKLRLKGAKERRQDGAERRFVVRCQNLLANSVGITVQ
jgi:hypothetical protein